MLRKLALAAAVGVPAFAAASTLALAEDDYDPVIVDTDDPAIVERNYDDRWEGDTRLTCGQARDALEYFGFEQIVRDECEGSTYTFVGQRDGELYTIHVDALTGEIVAG